MDVKQSETEISIGFNQLERQLLESLLGVLVNVKDSIPKPLIPLFKILSVSVREDITLVLRKNNHKGG